MSYKQWADSLARKRQATFVIYNPDEDRWEGLPDNQAARYWSNEFGWVPKADATRFTYAEMRTLNLPTCGYWVKER